MSSESSSSFLKHPAFQLIQNSGYTPVQRIAEGTAGVVFEVTVNKKTFIEDKDVQAFKWLSRSKFSKVFFSNTKNVWTNVYNSLFELNFSEILRELYLSKTIQRLQIPRALEINHLFFEKKKDLQVVSAGFAMPLYSCNLHHFLYQFVTTLHLETHKEAWNNYLCFCRTVLKHIAESLKKLHLRGLAHGDLKPANILLLIHYKKKKQLLSFSSEGMHQIPNFFLPEHFQQTTFEAVLSDFGRLRNTHLYALDPEAALRPPLSEQHLTPSQLQRSWFLDNMFCTTWYRSPEEYMKLRSSQSKVSLDVWAFGCLVFECAMLSPLFFSKSDLECFKQILVFSGPLYTEEEEKHFSEEERAFWSVFSELYESTKQIFLNTPSPNKWRRWSSEFEKRSKQVNLVNSFYFEKMKHLLNHVLHFHPDKRVCIKDVLTHPFFEEEAL